MGSSGKRDSKKGKSSSSKLTETAKSRRQPPQARVTYDELIADLGGPGYSSPQRSEGGPSSAAAAAVSRSGFPKHQPVLSDSPVTLHGPLEVAGGVRSGGSVTLSGDFDIHDRIEAYGSIDISGNVVCSGKIKAYGNINVVGSLSASERVRGFGRLRVVGMCDAQDLEIYGNLVVDGHLKCRNLTLYGSLTLIGEHSGYRVEGEEQVWGSKMLRDEEVEW